MNIFDDNPIMKTELNLPLLFRGKVRDVYDLKDNLLIVSTDRISAFDVVLPTPIPGKGKILTQMSLFWFDMMADVVKNHIVSGRLSDYPENLNQSAAQIEYRSMLVKKAHRINIECVVRGYLAGSAWAEYRKAGVVCGIKLPKGLCESDILPEAIFTPAIKAENGHDINISERQMIDNEGEEISRFLKKKSIELYRRACDYARSRGIIIADTKFEFGIAGGEIILIDEIFTPDSSRFWDEKRYKPGTPQDSYDKQFVRDYLDALSWDKTPPGPALPADVVRKTQEKYAEAFRKLTGKETFDAQ